MQINRPMEMYDPVPVGGSYTSYTSYQNNKETKPAYPGDAVDANGFSVHIQTGKHHQYNPSHVNCMSCEPLSVSLAKLEATCKATINNIDNKYGFEAARVNQGKRHWLRPFGDTQEVIESKLEELKATRDHQIDLINKEYNKHKEYLSRPANTVGKRYWYNYYENKYVEYDTNSEKLKQQLEASNKAYDLAKYQQEQLLDAKAAYKDYWSMAGGKVIEPEPPKPVVELVETNHKRKFKQ